MSSLTNTILSSTAITALFAAYHPSTFAQELDESLVLEEIVVTAQRREQNVLEVPVSLTVLSEEELGGLSDVRDLFYVAPTLHFQGGVSSSGQGLSIRGVGGGAFATGFEGSVGVVIDQVVTGPGGAALPEFWDVERIEVLNGPQGTLFGKNVSAGAINIVTRDPTEEFEGMAAIRWEGEYGEYRLDGVVSGPMTENLRARIAVYALDQDDGYIENPVRGKTENRKDRWGARVKTAYDNGPFEFNMSLAYENQDNECCCSPSAIVGLIAGFEYERLLAHRHSKEER